MTQLVRLVGVYDADGGLLGELTYLAGKVAGRHCSLCDITHSPVRRRREWDEYVAALPVPFDVVHRNERDGAVAAATAGREPCVVAQCEDGSIRMLLTNGDLTAAGNVEGLRGTLASAVTRAGLDWPASSSS